MRLKTAAVVGALTLLTGCAEFTHLTRVKPTTGRMTAFIDAKQRAIFYTGTKQFDQVSCAEPSPDALSALAAQGSGSAGTKSGTNVGLAFSLAEAAGSIGLRTQSIQLMRDHMFRLCEAYQSHAIGEVTFALLHRRFQTTMVGILAIEQLTGAVRPPAVVLGGSSSSGNAEAVLKLSAARDQAAASVTEANADVAKKLSDEKAAQVSFEEAVVARNDSASGSPERATAQTRVDDAQKAVEAAATQRIDAEGTLASRKAVLASMDRSLTLAQSSGSASASGVIETATQNSAQVAAVADAVSKIVDNTMRLQNGEDFCAIFMSATVNSPVKVNAESPLLAGCAQKLGFDLESVRKQLRETANQAPATN